jgi:hypothetical protein
MPFNVVPYAVSWAVLVCIVLALAAYKAALVVRAGREEPLHICNMSKTQAVKLNVAAHIETSIERWGEILTIVALVYGLIIAGVYVYRLLYVPPAF